MGMYQVPPVMGGLVPRDPTGQVRVATPKPKPQCWQNGCNGRQFLTVSNLLFGRPDLHDSHSFGSPESWQGLKT